MKKATLLNSGFLGFHMVHSDGSSRNGRELPFKCLETRTIDPAKVKLCERGYHWCKLPSDCVKYYNYGPVIEFCLFSSPRTNDNNKYVSSSKMVIVSANISDLRQKLYNSFYGKYSSINCTPIFNARTEVKFNKAVYEALGLTFGRGK